MYSSLCNMLSISSFEWLYMITFNSFFLVWLRELQLLHRLPKCSAITVDISTTASLASLFQWFQITFTTKTSWRFGILQDVPRLTSQAFWMFFLHLLPKWHFIIIMSKHLLPNWNYLIIMKTKPRICWQSVSTATAVRQQQGY